MRISRTRLSDWIHLKAHPVRQVQSGKETDGCHAKAPCAVQLRLKVKLSLKNPNFPVVSGQGHSPGLIFFKSAPEVRDLPSITAWVATGMYRQFPGRDFHPLVICTFVANQYIVGGGKVVSINWDGHK